VRIRSIRLAGAAIRIAVQCLPQQKVACKGTVRLTRSGRRISSRRLNVAPGKTQVLRLKLSRVLARRINRGKATKTKIAIEVAGALSTRNYTAKRKRARR
jgi:hypothetical protein